MRPILVLLLVIIGISALLFGVYSLLGDTDKGTEIRPPVQRDEPETARPPTPLSGGDASVNRTTPAPVPEERGREDPRQAVALGNVLRGTVLTPGNEPLADAQVSLSTHGTDALTFANDPIDRSKDLVTRTDDEGRYAFRDVPARDRYKIVAEHKDYAPTSMLSNRIEERGEFLEPPLVMQIGAQLTGHVQDTGGNAVPGAVLYLEGMYVLEDGENAERVTTRTDDQGFYAFKNVAQNDEHRTLEIEAEGYARQQRAGLIFRPDEQMKTIDFTLQPALMLAGRVLGPNNEGLARTRVIAVSTGQRGQSRTATNERGEFLFEDLAPGQYMLQARKPGYRYKAMPRVEAGESNVIIEMIEEGKVSGRVVDGATSLPLPTFTARLRFYYQEDVPTQPSEIQDKFSDPEGEFTLTGVKPGKYLVEGRAEGYAPSFSLPFTLTQSQDIAGVEVRMTAGGMLAGRVVDSAGEPVAGARVRSEDNQYVDDLFQKALGEDFPSNATARETRTDKDGRFELANLHPAQYQVIVNAVGYTELSVMEREVAEGALNDVGTLQLIAGGTLRGTLYDGAGNPIVAGQVMLEPTFIEDGLPYRRYETKSGADGKFRIANIYPGQYQMTASRSSTNTGDVFAKLLEAKGSEKPVVIGNDETVTENVTIND